MTRHAAAFITSFVPQLSELDVLIVDCQTTGATPALGSVLELGWCVVRPGVGAVEPAQAHWIALPAGHVVPPQVRRLTGYDARSNAVALAPEEAWRRLRASMPAGSAMPAAIHFARFEEAFLRDWASRFEPESPFPFDAVCVHAIACRLYPDLPRRSLRALAGYLGHGLHLARRALGHVEATAFIWRKLSAELAARGVRGWEDLSRFLAEPAAGRPRGSKRRYPLAASRYRTLPDAPGVYRFLRPNGDVLYVGKAASLRKRVASHFAGGSTTEQALEMLTQASDVQVTLTATALEAALLENESIKLLSPPYNVQLVGADRPAWFASERWDSVASTRDAVHRFGPLPSEFSVAALGALLSLVSGAEPTAALRARAVATSEAWAPSADVFAVAFAEFRSRHLAEDPSSSLGRERKLVLDAARRLAPLVKALVKLEHDVEARPAELEEPDPERVLRHMERAVAQSYQLLRRARWLLLLHDSAVVYREPESDRGRVLVVQHGDIVDSRDAALEDAVAVPFGAGAAEFDRAKYDRLRILTTELKRVHRDGGSVAVHVRGRRRLSGGFLDGVLRCL